MHLIRPFRAGPAPGVGDLVALGERSSRLGDQGAFVGGPGQTGGVGDRGRRPVVASGGFAPIYSELEALLEGPADGRVKGNAFELVVQWFLLNDPLYGLADGEVRLWTDAPEWRWERRDLGTDLLGRRADGSLVAVQAKAWRRDHSVTKAEVDSFLADSNRPQVAERIFATTSDRIAANARATLGGQEKPVTLITFATLAESDVVWPASLAELKRELQGPSPAPVAPTVLRPYQQAIVDRVVDVMEGGVTRGTVLMACGTGKTLTGQRISEGLESQRTLVLFPSLMLLKQTLQSWARNADQDRGFTWLAVCSDETVAPGADSPVDSVLDLGIPNVTTDPRHIEGFLRGRGRKVVFATYQSAQQVAAALAGTRLKFDLMLCDEAHRMARVVRTNIAAEQDGFTLPLRDDAIPARRRLFLTATPRVYSSRIKKTAAEAGQESLVYSMDDHAAFGPVVAEYSFRDAINGVGSDTGPVLADYRVLAVVVTEEEIEDLIRRRRLVAVTRSDGAVLDVPDAATLATHVAVMKAMESRRLGIGSLITYHHTIKQAREFQETHNRYRQAIHRRPIRTGLVTGKDPAYLRPEKLKILEDGRGKAIVSNARCLTEGIDVPLLDGVAFVNPRSSVIDIVQAVGRAMRKPVDSNKAMGYVIVPVFLTGRLTATFAGDTAGTPGLRRAADLVTDTNAAFAPIIEVLQNLRSMDGALTDQIRRLKTRRAAEPDGPSPALDEIDQDLHLEILTTTLTDRSDTAEGVQLGATTVDLKALTRAVHVAAIDRILNSVGEDWWARLGEAQRFRSTHKRPPTSESADPIEKSLGKWEQEQRTAFRQGHLAAERVNALEGLAQWEWQPIDAQWERNYSELTAWLNEKGRFPGSSKSDPRARQLNLWILSQRAALRAGRLTPERKARLEDIPGWSWKPHSDAWDRNYEAARQFRDRTGRAPSQIADDPMEVGIGIWEQSQRTAYNVGKQRLTLERIARLEQLSGWTWNRVDEAWDARYEAARKFRLTTGAPPGLGKSATDEERDLASWETNQRQHHRAGRLPSERVVRLEALPGWSWNPTRHQWLTSYRQYADFVRRHGRKPNKHRDDPKEQALGAWANSQRISHRVGRLDPEQIQLLESLPGWFWQRNRPD